MPLFNLSDDFYYFPQVSEQSYTDKAQGDPVLDRLIEGKPDYWIDPLPLREKKKKHLFIANLGIANALVETHVNELTKTLFQLEDAGFSINFLVDDAPEMKSIPSRQLKKKQIEEIFKESLDEDSDLSHLLPQQAIDFVVKLHSLSKDQVLIIDDFWMEYLLYEGTNVHYSIAPIIDRSNLDKLILKLSAPSNSVILHEAFYSRSLKEIDHFKDILPKAPPCTNYWMIGFNKKNDYINFVTTLLNGQTFSFPNDPAQPAFQLQYLAHITHFNLYINLEEVGDVKLLINLIKKCPNMESLDLPGLNAPVDFIFNKLRALRLHSGTITNLKYCPHLTSLECDAVNFTHLNLSANELPSLKVLDLIACDINEEQIHRLLKAAPNITTLYLDLLVDVGELIIMRELKHLTINSRNIAIVEQIEKRELLAPELLSITIKGTYDIQFQSVIDSLQNQGITVWHNRLGQVTTLTLNQNTTETLDAQTSHDPNTHYNLQRIFYSVDNEQHPHPASYRIDVYNSIEVNDKPCSIKKAFFLKKIGDLQLTPIEATHSLIDVYALAQQKKNDHASTYYGKKAVLLTHEWQSLPSLSPNEQLIAYHLAPETEIELSYSLRDNLYYFRSKKESNQNLIIDFILQVPQQNTPQLSPELEQQVKHHLEFTPGDLVLSTPDPTGQDYLQAMKTQKKGVCRHRSFAFKSTFLNHELRIIDNKAHSFVEIKSNGLWIKRDLGGGESTETIDDSYNPAPPKMSILEANIPIAVPVATPAPEKLYHRPILEEEHYLEAWQKKQATQESVDQYCQHLLQANAPRKQFIKLASTEQVHAMAYLIQKQCLNEDTSVFYVHSPADLVCSTPWIQPYNKEGQLYGKLRVGPGGRFYQFLTVNPQRKKQVLLINYENFKADDIVRVNSLLDTQRMIDGIHLPQELMLIGLANINNPKQYDGADFYSRFDHKPQAPAIILLDKKDKNRLKIAPVADQQGAPVSLFHSPNWKSLLLGHWMIDGSTLIFKEGSLTKALATGLPLIIKQGLWQNEEFCHFWQQAKTLGYIAHSGGIINIPQDTIILRDEDYDWENLSKNIQCTANCPPDALVLNPQRMALFLNRYHCDNEKNTLCTQPGFIEEAAQQKRALTVNVTRNLSDDQWAMLGDACNKNQVQLIVHTAPGVQLPSVLNKANQLKPIVQQDCEETAEQMPKTAVFSSSDVDATVLLLTDGEADWLIIDVTSRTAADLLTHTQASFNKESLTFYFKQTKMAVLKALDENKKVILKGQFSPELIDELAPLLLSRMASPQTGQLVLVANDPNLLHFLDIKIHKVSLTEKEEALCQAGFSNAEIYSLDDEEYAKKSFAHIAAQLRGARIHTVDPWIGLKRLPPMGSLEALRPGQDTKKYAQKFIKERKKQLLTTLKYAPYVYLTGLTGVGKTTFVEQEIQSDDSVVFFHGEEKITQWAMDRTADKLKILFIDEENLSHRDWNELEGLFHNPPSILINGVHYPLTAEHKVILAGNPLAYGDERRLASIFARHGNTLLFKPLPLACVYEYILKPVFANTKLADQSVELCQPLLELYGFLCTHSKKELLISPRELQMMALLTLSHSKQHPEDKPEDAALYYAYTLVKNLVPQKNQNAFLALDLVQKAQKITLKSPQPTSDSFLITLSRREIAQQLSDVLALSELRQNSLNEFNKAQLYGGLGGIVLTGEPGVGKSELATAVLRLRGYKECSFIPGQVIIPEQANRLPVKKFYRMPVSLPLAVRQALLLQAFDEGAVVVVDELNSSALLERWFNELLMGKHPITHKPAKIPGFCLIGTQNPVTMAGRKRASPAFIHRLIQTNVPDYAKEEIEPILLAKGLSKGKAARLAKTYQEKRHYAEINHLTPPTFRDLVTSTHIAQKGKYVNALKALDDAINKLPEGEIKTGAEKIYRLITNLRQRGERKLASFLIITTELLITPPKEQIEVFHRFLQKAQQAPMAPLSTESLLCLLIFSLGAIAMLAAALATTGLVGSIVMATSAIACTTSTIGFFALPKPIQLSDAMLSLYVDCRHSCTKSYNINNVLG